ncbi:MAG TPA: hypothetical protein PKC70_19030, partial [Cellvibrionaceae bacterium]|nr:hypothetical protein [Cellvibrionaceae bacterium]
PVGTFLLNEKRTAISQIEARHNARVVILPNADMVTPHYQVTRLRDDEIDNTELSYNIKLINEDAIEEAQDAKAALPSTAKAAISQITPLGAPVEIPTSKSEPAATAPTEAGIVGKLMSFFGNLFKSEAPAKEEVSTQSKPQTGRNRHEGRQRHRRDHRRDRNERSDRKEEITDNRSAESSDRPAQKPRHERADNRVRDEKPSRSEAVETTKNADRSPNDRSRNRRGRAQEVRALEPAAEANAPVADNKLEQEDRPQRRPNNRRPKPHERQRGPRTEEVAAQEEVAADQPIDLTELEEQLSAAIAENQKARQETPVNPFIDTASLQTEPAAAITAEAPAADPIPGPIESTPEIAPQVPAT